MNRTRIVLAVKYAVYALVLLILYVLQTTPGLFAIRGITPILVVPAAIAIAMHEGELAGGFYGALAGLFCDMSGRVLFGFNGLFISFFCVVAGLLVIHLMHSNLRNCILFVAGTMLATSSLEFFFGYGIWGHENAWRIYVFLTLPTVLYTVIVSPLLFLIVRKFHRKAAKIIARD